MGFANGLEAWDYFCFPAGMPIRMELQGELLILAFDFVGRRIWSELELRIVIHAGVGETGRPVRLRGGWQIHSLLY